jgi:3'-5' exoribonuclease
MPDIYQFEDKKEGQALISTDTGRRRKEQFIEGLKEGDTVNDFFAVKTKKTPRLYKKGMFFEFVAVDKTGEISVKFWGGENKNRIKRLYDSFSVGDVVQVRSGVVDVYDEKIQISVNENTGGIRRCSPGEYYTSDFIPALDEDKIRGLYEDVKREVEGVEDEQLKNLLMSFFGDSVFVDEFVRSPSAVSHHHNYLGGNLEHTVGVVRLCNNICGMYPGINKDLLISCALLHDIGKLREYRYNAAIDKTDEGNFIGHIVIGDLWIKEKIEELRSDGKVFSQELENQVRHLILSHHGRYEWGSPKMPKTVEACVLHYADLMDSQVKNYMQKLEEGKRLTNDEWMFIYDSGKKRPIFLGDY